MYCCQTFAIGALIFLRQIIEEIDAMQQKLNERTDKLNAMKNRHNELTRTLDETETHLKQASRVILHLRSFGIGQNLKQEQWTYRCYTWNIFFLTVYSLHMKLNDWTDIEFDHVSQAYSYIVVWNFDITVLKSYILFFHLQLLDSSDVVLNYIKRESNSNAMWNGYSSVQLRPFMIICHTCKL